MPLSSDQTPVTTPNLIIMISRQQSKQEANFTATDPLLVLSDWQQAIAHFRTLYEGLGDVISVYKQQPIGSLSLRSGSTHQYSVSELEAVQQLMFQELDLLADDMDSSVSMHQNIEQLKAHTAQLLKRASQVQKLLNRIQLGNS